MSQTIQEHTRPCPPSELHTCSVMLHFQAAEAQHSRRSSQQPLPTWQKPPPPQQQQGQEQASPFATDNQQQLPGGPSPSDAVAINVAQVRCVGCCSCWLRFVSVAAAADTHIHTHTHSYTNTHTHTHIHTYTSIHTYNTIQHTHRHQVLRLRQVGTRVQGTRKKMRPMRP